MAEKQVDRTHESHEDYAREEAVRAGSPRAFGFVFTAFFAVLGGIGVWTGGGAAPWWFAAAGAVLAIALTRPGWLAPANRAWLRLALALNRIVSPIVMGLVFFTTVVPIGLAMRVLGKDPLRLRLDPAAATYWIARRPPGPAPRSLHRQF